MRFTENSQKSNAYFSNKDNLTITLKHTLMKGAELLLGYMDQLQRVIEVINSYIDKGLELFHKAKEWIEKIIEYIGRGVDYLVAAAGGRNKPDHLVTADDYMFV